MGDFVNIDWDLMVQAIIASVVFSFVGAIFFGICLAVIRWRVPFSIKKEIDEARNTPLGIMLGSVIVGIAIIVSAAMKG